METALQLKNLSKSFSGRKVIDDISLEVYAGEVFGFLGPNGAGKTTTIKMIMGFLRIDRGEIFINGIDFKRNYEQAMAQVGGVVENPEMYRNLSGLLNLQMYARLHDGVTAERIDEVVRIVGMQNRIREKVKSYSLGMKQRLGLALAMLFKPKLLILDEPTNGLDPAGIKELRDILKHLAHQENVAVFVSSHMLSEMALMCDRVGIISGGRLVGVKPIEELIASASGKPVYRFTTKQAEQVKEVLGPGVPVKGQSDQYIDLEIGEELVPEINALLVTNGIAVFGVAKIESSLEDAYMRITGGGYDIE